MITGEKLVCGVSWRAGNGYQSQVAHSVSQALGLAQVDAAGFVDLSGFGSPTQSVLGRYAEGRRCLPTASELEARGIDLSLLAYCIMSGLVVLDDLNALLDSSNADEFNSLLEQVVENDNFACEHNGSQLEMALARIEQPV